MRIPEFLQRWPLKRQRSGMKPVDSLVLIRRSFDKGSGPVPPAAEPASQPSLGKNSLVRNSLELHRRWGAVTDGSPRPAWQPRCRMSGHPLSWHGAGACTPTHRNTGCPTTQAPELRHQQAQQQHLAGAGRCPRRPAAPGARTQPPCAGLLGGAPPGSPRPPPSPCRALVPSPCRALVLDECGPTRGPHTWRSSSRTQANLPGLPQG